MNFVSDDESSNTSIVQGSLPVVVKVSDVLIIIFVAVQLITSVMNFFVI